MFLDIQAGKYVTVNGIDCTHEYNECLFKPMRKHYKNATNNATFPLIWIASKCMRIGMKIGVKAFKEIVLSHKSPDGKEIGKIYAHMDADIDEAVNRFYSEEGDLIHSLPVTYYTRNRKNLTAYIHDEIKAGVLFLGEALRKLCDEDNAKAIVV